MKSFAAIAAVLAISGNCLAVETRAARTEIVSITSRARTIAEFTANPMGRDLVAFVPALSGLQTTAPSEGRQAPIAANVDPIPNFAELWAAYRISLGGSHAQAQMALVRALRIAAESKQVKGILRRPDLMAHAEQIAAGLVGQAPPDSTRAEVVAPRPSLFWNPLYRPRLARLAPNAFVWPAAHAPVDFSRWIHNPTIAHLVGVVSVLAIFLLPLFGPKIINLFRRPPVSDSIRIEEILAGKVRSGSIPWLAGHLTEIEDSALRLKLLQAVRNLKIPRAKNRRILAGALIHLLDGVNPGETFAIVDGLVRLADKRALTQLGYALQAEFIGCYANDQRETAITNAIISNTIGLASTLVNPLLKRSLDFLLNARIQDATAAKAATWLRAALHGKQINDHRMFQDFEHDHAAMEFYRRSTGLSRPSIAGMLLFQMYARLQYLTLDELHGQFAEFMTAFNVRSLRGLWYENDLGAGRIVNPPAGYVDIGSDVKVAIEAAIH